MKKLLILIGLSGIAFANTYTVFYPYDVNLLKCSTVDRFKVGIATMDITCIGIQDNKKVEYSEEIEMLPAPFKIQYVPGGVKDSLKIDD